MTEYVLRHPRSHLLLAKKERPRNLRLGAGFGQDYRWVRKQEEATRFTSYADAELPAIFLNLREFEIRPMLSCGLMGEPVTRDEAMANGTFHSVRAA